MMFKDWAMSIQFLKFTGILILWCFCVLCSDVQSAAFMQEKGSVLEAAFFFYFVGSLVAFLLCVLVKRCSWKELEHAANTYYEDPFFCKLVLLLVCVNVMATFSMFLSFTFAGMTHVYVVKTTEPLVICLFSTGCAHRLLRRRLPHQQRTQSLRIDVYDYSMPSKVISLRTWLSVLTLCLGAILISASLKHSGGASFASFLTLFSYGLVLVGNFALALRTTIMKPLLHVVPNDGSIFSSCFIHGLIMFLGAAVLLGPVLFCRGKYVAEYSVNTWLQIGVVGISFSVYQVCNGMVLFYVTPVTYSILKQVRVVLIFFFSVYYFGKEFESIGELIAGLILVFVGSVFYLLY